LPITYAVYAAGGAEMLLANIGLKRARACRLNALVQQMLL